MAIAFEDSTVQIQRGATTTKLLASTASVSIANPRRGIKSLGIPGFAGQVTDGPMVGSVSVSYYITDSSSAIRGLFGAGGGDAVQLFDVWVGTTKCTDVVMDSMSINIEPYTPITCEVNMSFYGGYEILGAPLAGPAAPDGVMHGGGSTVDPTAGAENILWNTDLVSCTYSINQSINPVYLLGNMLPEGYSIEDTTTEVTLEGIGLGKVLTFSELCPDLVEGSIAFSGVCAGATASLDFEGYVINPQITVEPNKEINGSLTVFGTF
jgi:hypothetical protein